MHGIAAALKSFILTDSNYKWKQINRKPKDERRNIMAAPQTQLIWVKDDAGNRFLCPYDALKDPNSLTEEEKAKCLHDASGIEGAPGDQKIKFGESASKS